MAISCEDCPQRPTCVTPCKAVERLLRRTTTRRENNRPLPEEFVGQYDTMVERGASGEVYLSGDKWPGPKRTKRALIILMWFRDHRDKQEIIYHTGAKICWINKVLRREIERRRNLAGKRRCVYKPGIQTTRAKIIKLWRTERYRKVDIARLAQVSDSYVSRVVQSYDATIIQDSSSGHK